MPDITFLLNTPDKREVGTARERQTYRPQDRSV